MRLPQQRLSTFALYTFVAVAVGLVLVLKLPQDAPPLFLISKAIFMVF
jgi:hypothetical protein